MGELTNSDTSPPKNKKRNSAKRRKTAPKQRKLFAHCFVALLKVQSGRQTHEAAVFPGNDQNYIKRQKLVKFYKKTTNNLHTRVS